MRRTGSASAWLQQTSVPHATATPSKQSNEKLDVERTEYWLSQGAQMSETVADIYKRAKEGKSKVRGVADPYTKKKNFKKEAAEA